MKNQRLKDRKERRKTKRTFSLSQASLAYLKAIAKNYRSTSEALDMLIREKQEQAEQERIVTTIL